MELLKQLQLSETELKLELGELLEEHRLICEHDGELHEELCNGQLFDGELHDELVDGELFDGKLDESELDLSLEEIDGLLELLDKELKLELCELSDDEGLIFDDD